MTETSDKLAEHAEGLRGLVDMAHALVVLRAGLEGERGRVVEDTAKVLGASAKTTIKALDIIRATILRDEREKRDAARIARNDELGIPNCDHLIYDPDCKECAKMIPPLTAGELRAAGCNCEYNCQECGIREYHEDDCPQFSICPTSRKRAVNCPVHGTERGEV